MATKSSEADGRGILPDDGEGFRIVEKPEALYVFGAFPMDWFGILAERGKTLGFDVVDSGAGQALGCWVFTNAQGSAAIRERIESEAQRKHGMDKLGVWLVGCDTGTSSLTIAHVIGRAPLRGGRPDAPYDPDDFGRCLRLVRLMDWRDRLDEVADHFPNTAWPAIIGAWDELAALFDEEATSGMAPKCYRRMQEFRETKS